MVSAWWWIGGGDAQGFCVFRAGESIARCSFHGHLQKVRRSQGDGDELVKVRSEVATALIVPSLLFTPPSF
jgi:hypothetical protein